MIRLKPPAQWPELAPEYAGPRMIREKVSEDTVQNLRPATDVHYALPFVATCTKQQPRHQGQSQSLPVADSVSSIMKPFVQSFTQGIQHARLDWSSKGCPVSSLLLELGLVKLVGSQTFSLLLSLLFYLRAISGRIKGWDDLALQSWLLFCLLQPLRSQPSPSQKKKSHASHGRLKRMTICPTGMRAKTERNRRTGAVIRSKCHTRTPIEVSPLLRCNWLISLRRGSTYPLPIRLPLPSLVEHYEGARGRRGWNKRR